MNKIYTWVNTAHGTSSNSALSSADYETINMRIISGDYKKNIKNYKKYKILRENLCPHFDGVGNCACGHGNKIVA